MTVGPRLPTACVLGRREVRVLDETHQISKRIGDGRDANAFPNIPNGGLEGRSRANELLDRLLDVADAPIRHRPSRARFDALGVGIQPKLEATNVEANVERLVEVWLDAEGGAVPLLGALEIGNVVDRSEER